MEIEYWEQPNQVLLVAEVSLGEDKRVEVDDLSIIIYIGGIDYDLTEGFIRNHYKTYRAFEEKMRLHAADKYMDDLKFEGQPDRTCESGGWDGDAA